MGWWGGQSWRIQTHSPSHSEHLINFKKIQKGFEFTSAPVSIFTAANTFMLIMLKRWHIAFFENRTQTSPGKYAERSRKANANGAEEISVNWYIGACCGLIDHFNHPEEILQRTNSSQWVCYDFHFADKAVRRKLYSTIPWERNYKINLWKKSLKTET